MAGKPRTAYIHLTEEERRTLETIIRAQKAEQRQVTRAKIILLAADTALSYAEIAAQVGCSSNTVSSWCVRFALDRFAGLADLPRSGTPPTITEAQILQILAVATRKPEDCGRTLTHWSARELAEEVMQQQIVPSIHWTTISAILRKADIKPHLHEYWLNSPDAEFQKK